MDATAAATSSVASWTMSYHLRAEKNPWGGLRHGVLKLAVETLRRLKGFAKGPF